MKWQLSDEQVAYRDALRGWLSDVAPTEAVRRWLAEGSTTFQERLAGDGWVGVGIHEHSGGQGGGLLELALTAELLGGAAAPSASWLATVLAAPALAARPDVVAAALVGEPVAVLCPCDVLPDLAPHLAVDPEGRVSGGVPRVLAAAEARRFVVVVNGGSAAELRLVERGAGVQVRPHRLLDRSRSAADVVLDLAPSVSLDVAAGDFLAGYASRAAVLVAADSLGAMERMLGLAVAYGKQRHQFGVPIGSFQAVKHAAAGVLVDVEAGRSAVYYTAAAVDLAAPRSALQAAAVKAQVTSAAAKAADTSLSLHGAIGYTWEHDLQLFYKRAKLNAHLVGSARSWNERIAEGLDLVAR